MQTRTTETSTPATNRPSISSTTSRQLPVHPFAERGELQVSIECRTDRQSPIHRHCSVEILSPRPVRIRCPGATPLKRIESPPQAPEGQPSLASHPLLFVRDASPSGVADVVSRRMLALPSPDSLSEGQSRPAGDDNHNVPDDRMADIIDGALARLERLLEQLRAGRSTRFAQFFERAQARATAQIGDLRHLALRFEHSLHGASLNSLEQVPHSQRRFHGDSEDTSVGDPAGCTPSPKGPLNESPGHTSSSSEDDPLDDPSLFSAKEKSGHEQGNTSQTEENRQSPPIRRRSPTCAWWTPGMLTRARG